MLLDEITQKREEITSAIQIMKKRGIDLAEREAEYKKALAKMILLEREKGIPVTIINDICRGDPKIAQVRLERDIAEVLYKTAHEKVLAVKVELHILENQFEMEWKNSS